MVRLSWSLAGPNTSSRSASGSVRRGHRAVLRRGALKAFAVAFTARGAALVAWLKHDSSTGAQVLVRMRLRPSEPLRLALVDSDRRGRVRGVVAWSSPEAAAGGPAYGAGMEFINPDAPSLDVFRVRRTTTSTAALAG